MGLVYFKSGDFTAADKCFQSGLLLAPNHKGLLQYSKIAASDQDKKKVFFLSDQEQIGERKKESESKELAKQKTRTKKKRRRP